MNARLPEADGPVPAHELTDVQAAYLDLLKKCLTRIITGGEDYAVFAPGRFRRGWRVVDALLKLKRLRVVRQVPFDPVKREEGLDWPAHAETMIGVKRLENLQAVVADVVKGRVPGDLVETGAWRGGACIFMRGVLLALGDASRRVWVCDSFRGLPPPSPSRFPADAGDVHFTRAELEVSEEAVRANFARYGLLDDRVRFLPGWFRDTLPTAPIERIAVLRVDADMYESTWEALASLHSKVTPGGYVIVDDYGAIAACRQAVTDFRREHRVADRLHPIDTSGVYWRRSATGESRSRPEPGADHPRDREIEAAQRPDQG